MCVTCLASQIICLGRVYWHERWAIKSVAARRLIVDSYFHHYFQTIFPFSSILSPSNQLHKSKTTQTQQKMFRAPLVPPSIAFFEPPCGNFRFCRQCGVASNERLPPFPLGWYFLKYFIMFVPQYLICLVTPDFETKPMLTIILGYFQRLSIFQQ